MLAPLVRPTFPRNCAEEADLDTEERDKGFIKISNLNNDT